MKLNYLSTFLLVSMMIIYTSCESEGGSKNSTFGSNQSHNMGQNCMNCHNSGNSEGGTFSIAGTVYRANLTSTFPNATVNLTTLPGGAGTVKYTIQVDAKGNFYTSDNINFGIDLYPSVQGNVSTKYMSTPITTGQCSSCHGVSTSKIWTE